MSIDFSDSARNRETDQRHKHVFDGGGENVSYHSDNESLGSRKSKTRYINPAIYIESIGSAQSVSSLQTDNSAEIITPHPHTTYRSTSTPFLSASPKSNESSIKRKLCTLGLGDTNDYEPTPRNLTYRELDTFRLSVASVSTTTTAQEERDRHERKKDDAYQQWLARKEHEKREKAKLNKKPSQQPQPTAQEKAESFRRWKEHKRLDLERRKAEEIMLQYRYKEKQEAQRNKRELEKEKKLAEWISKKEEAMKAMKTREERKAARAAIEEERRRASGERAYRDWLRGSRGKPLPVPLNRGELSMRGSVSEMYINPIPWQGPT